MRTKNAARFLLPAHTEALVKVPTRKVLALWERRALQAGLTGLGGILAGAMKVVPDAMRNDWSVTTTLAAAGSFVALVGAAIGTFKAHAEDSLQADPQDELRPFYAFTFTLHRVLLEHYRKTTGKDDGGSKDFLRITIHGVEDDQLTMALEYVGGDGGKSGRKFSARTGVIGKAVLQKSSIFAARKSESEADFRRELVDDYNCTQQEAHEYRADRRSWGAVPIMVDDIVVAVVFLDSSSADFFASNREIIQAACAGLAAYGRLRGK